MATAMLNARGARRFMPPVVNVLELVPPEICAHVIEEATAALDTLPALREVLALQRNAAFEPPMPQAHSAFQEELEEYCSMVREHLDEAEQLFGIAEDDALYPPEGPDEALRSRLLIICALSASAVERLDSMRAAEGGGR